MARLDGDFDGGCCVFEGERGGLLLCRPETPEECTGNQWFWFTARLTAPPGTYRVRLRWPENNPELMARIEYGRTENVAPALPGMMHASPDLERWRPIADVRAAGQDAEFEVRSGGEPCYVAVGMPWLRRSHEKLMREVRSSPLARVDTVAATARGFPVEAVRIGPDSGPGGGTFHLQGLQHASEWAGGRVLASMVRYLLGPEGKHLRERFTWRIVPAVNIDALDDRRHGPPVNMNRDWTEFRTAETAGLRDYILDFTGRGERLLHALDLHMGWHDREHAASSITAIVEGRAPEEVIARQIAVAEHVFARTEFTEHVWRAPYRMGGRSFATWCYEELGVPAQTLENSRHLVRERATGSWVRIEQRHEEALGRELAEALATFPW